MRIITGRLPLMLLSATAMYFLDPRSGRRRRSLARDRAASAACDAGCKMKKAGRMIGGELRGLQAMARRLLSSGEAPDQILAERVRSRMGRFVSHPGTVEVKAESGVVTLKGSVPEVESSELLRCVQSVWGVRAVQNELKTIG